MFFLKFFSFKTKLILSLVFVLIIVVTLGYNYFQSVNAENVSFTETFSTLANKDVNITTGKWDTVLGLARLLGKDWVNMAETKDGLETISSSGINYIYDVEYDSAGNPYIVGIDKSRGRNLPFFVKWTPSMGWTNMAETIAGQEILYDTGFSASSPELALDSNDNPYLIWGQLIPPSGSEADIFFTKWSPSACGGAGCWTNMAGTTAGPEEIAHNGYRYNIVNDIKIDSSNYPQVLYSLDMTGSNIHDLFFSRWNGASWTKANGIDADSDPATYESDNITNTPAADDQLAGLNLVNDNPYVAWYGFSNTDVLFSKWTPGLGLCADPVGCWTNMQETILGPEKVDQPNVVGYPGTYFSAPKNNFKIATDNNVYISWSYETPAAVPGQPLDVYIRKGIAGVGWSQIDNSPGYTNVSNSALDNSNLKGFSLDSANNPNVIWGERPGGWGGTNNDVYFARWNGSSWVKMDGTPAPENITNSADTITAPEFIVLDSFNTPYVLYYESSGRQLKKWSGSIWGKMDGSAGYELLTPPSVAVRSLDIINSNPQFIGDNNVVESAYFSKYLPTYNTTSTIQSVNVSTAGTDFIKSAALTANQTLNGQNIIYSISNDGGATWTIVPGTGTLLDFSTAGNDLRWKADLQGTSSVTPIINDLSLSYQTRKITCSLTPNSVLQGQSVTISASTGFAAPKVWATVEKDGSVLSTVDLVGGPNNWSYQFPTGSQNFGQNDVAVFTTDGTDTFVCNPSTGADWQMMTKEDIPWDRRYTHSAVSFNNRLFVMGGITDRNQNDIWYSADNGVNWTGPATAAWSPRSYFGLVNFQGQLWLLGGSYMEDTANDVPSTTTYNDIWVSSNGLNWTPSTPANAPWIGRLGFGSTVYDGKIWIAGGYDYLSATYMNDVWSFDGTTWVNETTLPTGRYGLQLAAWDEDGSGLEPEKLWVIAGRSTGGVREEDVHSYDTISGWNCVAGPVAYGCPAASIPAWGAPPVVGDGRLFHQVLIYNDPNDALDTPNMYLMGGQTVFSGEYNFNDVWVTTTADAKPGADWNLVVDPDDYYPYTDPPTLPQQWTSWSGRRNFAATIHDGKMWVLGGYGITTRSTWNDVWYSDNGNDWNLVGENYGGIFQKRWGTQLTHLDPDGPLGPIPDKLFILGGTTGAVGSTNDVWSSVNGTDWTLELYSDPYDIPTPTRWLPRNAHQVVTYNNNLYLVGGCSQGGSFCYGYCSITKKRCTNDILIPAIAAVNCDSVTEGICLPGNFNDVWSSPDGVSWNLVTDTPAWEGRYYPTVSVFDDGTGEKIWMLGGQGWRRCIGGVEDGAVCDKNASCDSNVCSRICYGGDRKGLSCTTDANCPASVCAGGQPSVDAYRFLKDVWFTSDGSVWYSGFCTGGANAGAACNKNSDCASLVCTANKAAWSARNGHSSVAYNDGSGEKLYVMGGWDSSPASSLNDVWSTSDGKNWSQIALLDEPGWLRRYTHQIYNYDDKIFLLGGNTFRTSAPNRNLLPALWTDEVWTSVTGNGSDWTPVTTDAPWRGRDFFSSTIFNNRMWLTGGDSSTSAMNDVWASTYDYSSMNFTVSTPPGSTGSNCTDTKPEDPGDVVAPTLPCVATSSAEIDWNFVDNAACEMGYRLYDATTDIRMKYVEQPNLSTIEETGLATNIQYSRYVTAYNAAGESGATSPASCYTLAKVPNKPIILSANENEIILQIDPNDGNPPGTEYEIKELLTNQFVQADGTFGTVETWQTYAAWGGDSGLAVIGELPAAEQPLYEEPSQQPDLNAAFHISLTAGQNYSFVVQAKNGDGILTGFSPATGSTSGPTGPAPVLAPIITAAKGVAINLVRNSNYNVNIFAAALAESGFGFNANTSKTESLLREFSLILNLLILILLGFLSGSIISSFSHLGKDLNWQKRLKLLGQMFVKEPAVMFSEQAQPDKNGIYQISFEKHKQSQLNAQKHVKRALGLIAIKAVVLVTLLTGLAGVNHLGKAQTAPYDQSGTAVNVGDKLSYIIEISNSGTAAANDAVVMDTIDSNLENFTVTGIINCGTYTDKSTATVLNVDGVDVAEASTCVITYTAKVKTGTEGNTITNQALALGPDFATVTTNITINSINAAPALVCGNNKIDPGEQCDPTGCASDERCVSCRCQPIPPTPVCGNNIVETGEQCDNTACGADQICSNCACQSVIPPIPPVIPPPVTPPGTLPPGTLPPGTPPGTLPPSTPPGIPLITPIISSISGAIDQILPEQLKAILDNPQVEQTSQNIVTPILLALALLNTVPLILALSIYLLPYLHLLFLEPLLILFGKKRKKWGVVYNALTKIPIDLALVRLYRKNDNMLVQTRVTDKEGRYIIIAKEPGKYYLSVTKPGFISPTRYLRDENQDTKYLDLYHGEVIEVTEKDAVITANIPLDPAEKMVLPIKEVVRSYLLKNLRLIISYIGMVLALLIVIIYPTVITIGALILHVILFLIFRRMIVPAKPKRWGIVYDAENKAPLHQAIVRIFDTRFNKLLETQVTDRNGRYAFLVGKNEYQLLTEKEGYKPKEVKPVDLVKNEEIVNLDVGLNRI